MEERVDGCIQSSSDGWKDGWMDICLHSSSDERIDLYIAQDGWKEGFGSSLFL